MPRHTPPTLNNRVNPEGTFQSPVRRHDAYVLFIPQLEATLTRENIRPYAGAILNRISTTETNHGTLLLNDDEYELALKRRCMPPIAAHF